jgi:hypothetical protein
MNRNDSPRNINKLYEIVKDIFSSKVSLDKFSPEFIEALQNEDDNYVVIVYLEH